METFFVAKVSITLFFRLWGFISRLPGCFLNYFWQELVIYYA